MRTIETVYSDLKSIHSDVEVLGWDGMCCVFVYRNEDDSLVTMAKGEFLRDSETYKLMSEAEDILLGGMDCGPCS